MGDVDGAVDTLRQAAEDFNDPQFRFEAALTLVRAGREPQASAELNGLLASAPPDWTGQAEALRLTAQLAVNAGEYERATDLLRAALEHETSDARTRWGLVHILLRRGSTVTAWRVYEEHPEPLEPSGLADAHAWIELHREFSDAESTVRGCLRLMRQFPDSEELSVHALAALVGPGSVQGELPADLLAELHSAMDDFFTRWPDSQLLHRIGTENTEQLLAQMTESVRTTTEQRRQQRELTAQLMLGRLPLGVLAAAVGRSYAEVVLRRGVGVLPAWHPDPAEHASCIKSVGDGFSQGVVVDTTTAAVLDVLPEMTRTALITAFRQLIAVDDALHDARAARDALSPRIVGTLLYDEHAQVGRFIETLQEEAERLAEEAQHLVRTIEGFHRRPRPLSRIDPNLEDETFRPWASLLDLARSEDLAVWADDGPLRILARSINLRAFSTPAALQVLTERGDIAPEQHEQALRSLIQARVGDVPLDNTRLLEIAEDQQWAAGAVAVALGRPAVWIDPARAFDILRLILQAVRIHRPEAVNDWLYLAVRGASYTNPDNPQANIALTATILASAIYLTRAQGEPARVMLSATRRALADTAVDPDSVSDPLPATAQLLRDTLAKALPYAMASQYVLAVFASLEDDDLRVVRQTMLR
jgi:tetratricopeptide (TPR) repeat protein